MSKRYEHTIIIGIDGMGNFNRNANTPNIDALFENGAVTYTALSMDPTISAENWGAMLIGCNPAVHGLTNSIVSRYEYKNKELSSLQYSRARLYFLTAVSELDKRVGLYSNSFRYSFAILFSG